jgi:hypothetical protein
MAHSTLGILNVLQFLENALLKRSNLTSTLERVTNGRGLIKNQRSRRQTEDQTDPISQPPPEFSVSVFGELKKEGELENRTVFSETDTSDKDVSELFLDPANFQTVKSI